ncbi:MAG: hypothetical protein J5835_02935 [Bacteroidales bacterium]|nr:hypothetical protein [Bacteroidales bacterium]
MANRILIGLTALALPLVACTMEELQQETPAGTPLSLSLGFEQPTPLGGQTAETKTYMLGDGTTVGWTTSNASSSESRVIVFDSKGGRNNFTSGARSAETVRPFSGTITAGSTVKYILWHGFSDTNKVTLTETSGGTGTESISAGGSATLETKADISPAAAVFSGTCLTLPSTQNITNYHSFNNQCNFAVMREGDSCLKSVFGYIRYVIPISIKENNGTIRRIKIKADEDLAGQVEIDYSGTEPIARVVANGSKEITVNSRWQTNGNLYEYGPHFAVLPVGTYHNMELEITTFAGNEGGGTQDAATNEPFTVYIRGEVVVERGKYTDLGNLPLAQTSRTHTPVVPDPSRYDQEYYDSLFDTDYFEKFTDPGGVVSYRIKSAPIGWDNSQSQYYVTKGMTNDERFIFFMVSENEFRPSYHIATEKAAKILDLQTRKMYTFYANDGCYPYLDPVNDVIYYCLRADDRKSARFYKRDLLNSPDYEEPLAEFPPQLVPQDAKQPIVRVCSHLTLTQDRRKVFLDSRVVDTFYQGLLDLYTGEWTEWSHNENQLNLTHGQLNPVRDDEALIAVDAWTDKDGVEHKFSDYGIGWVDNGSHEGAGTYRRMNIIKPDGSLTVVQTHPLYNGATHDGWHPDGQHIYWCCGWSHKVAGDRYDEVNEVDIQPFDGGFHIRRIHNSNTDTEVREGELISRPVVRATHCNFTMDHKYVVHDDDHMWRKWSYFGSEGIKKVYPNYPAKELLDELNAQGYPYPTEEDYTKPNFCYRGGPWRVWFYNMETRKDVVIYTNLPQITNVNEPSRIHPDPHPHFVCNDKYIVCTAYGYDGNIHWSITPVDQLITLSE